MIIDFFNFHLEFHEETKEIVMFVKVGALQLSSVHKETFLFTPSKDNQIILDLHTGNVKNPQAVFCFLTKHSGIKEYNIQWLMQHAMGFTFEIEQAYDKALFYRAVRNGNNVKNSLY